MQRMGYGIRQSCSSSCPSGSIIFGEGGGMKLIVAITGASGAGYALDLLAKLAHYDIEVYLVMSKWAEKVIVQETRRSLTEIRHLAKQSFANNEMSAPLASSSFLIDGMVIIPCTVKTASEIANAHCGTLIARAADNMLKTRKKLVLCLRETPLSTPVLEQIHKISLAGGIIMPLCPGFYHQPRSLQHLFDFMSSKVMDCLQMPNEFNRWDGNI